MVNPKMKKQKTKSGKINTDILCSMKNLKEEKVFAHL